MKIHDVQQGTDEWRALRIGIPTASAFDRIIQPSTGKPSASATKYLGRLLAEWYLGKHLDDYVSEHMQRGTEMEQDAVGWWEFETGMDSTVVGFVTTDDGRLGCSPDRLVGDDGGLEVKVPGIERHAAYLIDESMLVAEYKTQVYGALLVTGRAWWEIVSFSPVLPSVRVRVERAEAEDFLGVMSASLAAFCDRLDGLKRTYARLKDERDRLAARVQDEHGQRLLDEAVHPF